MIRHFQDIKGKKIIEGVLTISHDIHLTLKVKKKSYNIINTQKHGNTNSKSLLKLLKLKVLNCITLHYPMSILSILSIRRALLNPKNSKVVNS